jgi:hypothetical protein
LPFITHSYTLNPRLRLPLVAGTFLVLFELSEMHIPVETGVGLVWIGCREVGEAASMRAVAPKTGDAGPEVAGAEIHCRRGGHDMPLLQMFAPLLPRVAPQLVEAGQILG